ncbi:MAG: hypothetical protein CVT48_02260 [Thermoplasmata archaeon HGW-Thermoplasmata-1]|nr:MAG: hypothetical protein CVT48_02260 [Thermoplasmata archaeon HGW-Thermoplasmata-1]
MDKPLSRNEKLILYGITAKPELKDRELAECLGMSQSTVTTIRQRLHGLGMYRLIRVPMLQNMGCEMLTMTYTNFNPVVPLEERVSKTGKIIESAAEIVFSAGELQKGFSIAFSKNYTQIGKINEQRTKLFGDMALLEKEYPNEVVMPFQISTIYRFLNFAPLLKKVLDIKEGAESFDPYEEDKELFKVSEPVELSDIEKSVYHALIKYPEESYKDVAARVGVSRHTVGKMKRDFKEAGLMRTLAIPNFLKLDLGILAFYPIKFAPTSPPTAEQLIALKTDSMIFMTSRKFETVMIGFYPTYHEYKGEKTRLFQVLKEGGHIKEIPFVRTFSVESMVIIKDFSFAPIVKKILQAG